VRAGPQVEIVFGGRESVDIVLARLGRLRARINRFAAPHTDEGDAAGSPSVQPDRRLKDSQTMALKSSTSHIAIILAALVNGGGVRPEDFDTAKESLTALQANVEGDETKIADLEARVAALEGLDNGLGDALDPAASSALGAGSDTLTGGAGPSTDVGAGADTLTTAASADLGAGADTVTGTGDVQTASVAPQAL
jgi:hypothetical protein